MRLIDADALKAKWYGLNDIDETDRGARFVGYTEIARLIDQAPTIDAIEVVRCKDCRRSDWYETLDGEHRCYCMEHGSSGHIDGDYCSYGEREEGEAGE